MADSPNRLAIAAAALKRIADSDYEDFYGEEEDGEAERDELDHVRGIAQDALAKISDDG